MVKSCVLLLATCSPIFTGFDISSISSMMTVLVEILLLGARELTALMRCPVEVPTKSTSNLEPSGAITCGSTSMAEKPVLNPVLRRTGDPKKGDTASFIRGWVLMKFKFASVNSLLLLGQDPEIKEAFRNSYITLSL